MQRITERGTKWLKRRYALLTQGRRKLPDFVIIGVQKGGTSSLFHYLSQHPQLSLPTTKEIHFFDKNHHRGLGWYRAFFPFDGNGVITGEATPYYIFHPQVPQRLQAACPNAKLIVMLRNPADRAFSHFNMNKRRGQASDFDAALQRELSQLGAEASKLYQNPDYKSDEHQIHSYLKRGKYYEQISRWLQHFDKGQFLFIKSENFFANPKAELQRVYSFLGIDAIFPDNLNPKNVGNYDMNLSQATQAKLKAYFESDAAQLKDLLGEGFAWC